MFALPETTQYFNYRLRKFNSLKTTLNNNICLKRMTSMLRQFFLK